MLGLLSTALAGSIYINGVKADGITNFELDDVDVVIDSKGDVYIDAPRYAIEVRSPGGDTVSPGPVPVVQADGTISTDPAEPTGLEAESWWLVSEDNGSLGQEITVTIGGQPVAVVKSGDPQLMLDVSAFLRTGDNVVTFTSAGGDIGGGILSLYIGPGTNNGGTLQLESPALEYARRASDAAPEEKQLTLSIR